MLGPSPKIVVTNVPYPLHVGRWRTGLALLPIDLSDAVRMRAVVIHVTGGPEVLSLKEVPPPEPADGQALVRVHGTSGNPVDWEYRRGFAPKRAHELSESRHIRGKLILTRK